MKTREERIREKVYEEIACTVRDVLQHMDDSASNQNDEVTEEFGSGTVDVDGEERARAAGGILNELVKVVLDLKYVSIVTLAFYSLFTFNSFAM